MMLFSVAACPVFPTIPAASKMKQTSHIGDADVRLGVEVEFKCQDDTHFFEEYETKTNQTMTVICENNGEFDSDFTWPTCVPGQ